MGAPVNVALVIEGVVGRFVDREEAVCETGPLEPLRFSLSSSDRLMRVLGSVVRSQSAIVEAPYVTFNPLAPASIETSGFHLVQQRLTDRLRIA